jgi:hypothetical protein
LWDERTVQNTTTIAGEVKEIRQTVTSGCVQIGPAWESIVDSTTVEPASLGCYVPEVTRLACTVTIIAGCWSYCERYCSTIEIAVKSGCIPEISGCTVACSTCWICNIKRVRNLSTIKGAGNRVVGRVECKLRITATSVSRHRNVVRVRDGRTINGARSIGRNPNISG